MMSKFIGCQSYNSGDLCDCIINVDDIIYIEDCYQINDSGEKEFVYSYCVLKSYSSCGKELRLKCTVKELSKLINKMIR